jgi:TPP-dependent indolepyruvate ferredoxin oxidoreductase alpha subunit
MLKNTAEIVAGAIHDAGAGVVTHVPGFGASQVFDAFRRLSGDDCTISFHEEVAYTIAHGAALTGRRAATVIKAHGLAKAANSVVDSLAAGTTAGFLTIVADDRRGQHSDSILDVSALLDGLGLPHYAPQPRDAYNGVVSAFARSERQQLPVALVLDSEALAQSTAETPRLLSLPAAPVYRREVTRHLVCPVFADYQRRVGEARRLGLDIGVLSKPAVPLVPESLPAQWQSIVRSYVTLFEAFKHLRDEGQIGIVAGDTGASGLFGLPPFDCVDIGTCMGGSLPLAIGAWLAGHRNTWAVTGDFAFIAAGHLGLLEALQRGVPLKVLIFYNARSQSTGGQPIPVGTLERLLAGYTANVQHIRDPQRLEEVMPVLADACQANEMRIVIADYRDR